MGMNNVNPSSVAKNIINPGKKKASKAPNQETKPEADQKQEHLAQPNSQHFRANFIIPQVGAKSSKQSGQKTYDYEAAFKKMTESCENKPNKKALLEAIKHLKIAMADETGSSYHIDGTNFHQVTTWFESAILSDKYETKEISEEFIVNVLKELKEHMNYYNSGNIVRLLASIDKDRIPQKEAGLVTELYDMFEYYNEDQRFNKEFMDSIAKKWNIGKESSEQTEPTVQPQEQPAVNSLNPVDVLSETVGPNSVNESGQPKQEIENIDSELTKEQLAKHNSFAAAFDTVVKKYEAKNQQLPESIQNLKDMMQQYVDGDYHYLINEKNVVRVTTSLLLARCQNKYGLLDNDLVENILTECKKYTKPENVGVLASNLVWDISCRYIPVDSNGTIIVADFLENFKGNIDKNNLGDVSKALSWAMFRENIPKGQEGTHLVMEFLNEFKGKIDTDNLGDVAAMIERAIYNKNIPEDQEGNKIITELLKEFQGNIDTKNASKVANMLSLISYENIKKDQECINIIEKLLNECKQHIDKDMYTRLQAKFNFPETSPSSSTPLQVQQPAQTGEPLQKKSASAAYFKAVFDSIELSEELETFKTEMDVDGKENYDINGENINEVTSDFLFFLKKDSPKVDLEFAIKFLEYVKKDELFNEDVYNSSRVFMGVILKVGEEINDENKKTILECIENCIQKDANSVVKAFNSIVMYDSDIFTDYEKKIFSKEILDKCIEKLGSGADPENIVKMINNLYSHTPITKEGGRKKDKNDFRIILETLKSKRVITNAKSAENIQGLLIKGMRYGSDDDKLIDGTEEIVKDLADECQRYLKQLDFDLVTKLSQAKEKQIHPQEHPVKVEHKGSYSSRILQGPPSNFTPVNKGTTVQQPTQVTLQQSKLSTSLQKVKVLLNENVPEDFNNLEIALKNGTESPHIDRDNVENVLDKLATVLHNNRISSCDSASKFVINILQESTKFISFDDAVVDLEVFNAASHAAQNTAYALACAIINLDYIPRKTDKNLIEYISKLCEDFSLPEGPNQPRTIIANCLAGMNMSSTTDTAQVQQHNQVKQKSPQNPRNHEGSPSRATVKTRSNSAPSMVQQPMLTQEQQKFNNYFVQVFNGMISDGGQLPKELQELKRAMIQQRGGKYYYLIDKTNLFNVTENIVKALMESSGKKNPISEQTLLYLIKQCKDSIGLESSDGYKERANAVVFLLNSIVSLVKIKNTGNLKEIIKSLNIDKKLKEQLNSKLAQAITKNI